jgi:hypothetical protein
MNQQGTLMRIGPWCLLILGLFQMTGDILNIPLLKGLGAASAASPAPKVFSAVKGLETYSTSFFIEWKDIKGESHSLLITPEVYCRIQGPYNRRNVYGAALAYGPVLPKNVRESVMIYALSGRAPLLQELGIDPTQINGSIRVRMEPLAGTSFPRDVPVFFEVNHQ